MRDYNVRVGRDTEPWSDRISNVGMKNANFNNIFLFTKRCLQGHSRKKCNINQLGSAEKKLELPSILVPSWPN